MNAECLIFRKLTLNEFKAITNTINSEGGGSQTYIDFPKGCISDEEFKDFFQNEGTPNRNGYEWIFYVNSLSIGRTRQKEIISARRDSSNSLREQNNHNRIEIWKSDRSGFPIDVYDDKNNPIIVFILRSDDKEYWAGWFYRNQCDDSWAMTKGLSSMLWKDCAYVKFDSPIPFDTKDFKWPFLKNNKSIIDIKLIDFPLQQIYYGAPGTGKSHETNKVAKIYPNTIRTTFHPDSDYSTFVGTYKPTTTTNYKYGLDSVGKTVPIGLSKDENGKTIPFDEKKVEYKFVKQSFLKAYIKAWKSFKDTCVDGGEIAPQFLIIEEINRGNCAQIFGDLFQLLDRNKEGFSEYPIETDEDIVKALLEDKPEDNLSFGKEGLKLLPEQINYINSAFNNEIGLELNVAERICKGEVLVLPCNFYIWATMNTSDQSLFPIDSAFKRRWDWKYMKIREGKNEKGEVLDWKIIVRDRDKNNVNILGKEYLSWWAFIQKINEIIASMTLSADKQLGYFFCKAKEGVIDERILVGKVIFYLWNDVFKDYGFEDSFLFRYITNIDGNDVEKDLTFPDFYDEDGENIDSERLVDFIEKVMNWKKTNQEND
jgi:hypothetical protein